MKKIEYINKISEIENDVIILANELRNEEYAPYCFAVSLEVNACLQNIVSHLEYLKGLLELHCDLLVDIETVGEKVIEIED